MKKLGKIKKEIAKSNDTDNPKPYYGYRLYVRSDETNSELIESSVPLNGEEFLNRDISKYENDETLAKSLISGNYYCCGKRLVKFVMEIPYLRIIVCDMARLTPEKVELPYGHYFMRENANVNLDGNGEEKDKKIKIIEKPISDLKEKVYV